MGGKKKSFPCSAAPGAGTTHLQPPMGDEILEEHLMQQPSTQPADGRARRVRDEARSPAANTRRGCWSVAEDLCFLTLLREMMMANNHDHDNINRGQFEILLSQYNEKTPGDKVDKHQLYCRLKTLKQLYSLNRALRSKRGWTWDDNRKMAIAPDDRAWEELIECRKQYVKVRRKPFPQYDTMDQIFGRNMPHDLREESEGSASSKELVDVERKDNGVHYVPPLAQMPPNFVHAQEQRPEGANMDGASSDPISDSSSSRKRPGNKSGSVKRRRGGHLLEAMHFEMLEAGHERTQCIARCLQDRDSWKDDVREAHNKIRSAPGVTLAQRVAGMMACRNPTTRMMVMMFEPDELQFWLERVSRERHPESFEAREKVEVSPGAPVPEPAEVSPGPPVPDPAACVDDLVKTRVFSGS